MHAYARAGRPAGAPDRFALPFVLRRCAAGLGPPVHAHAFKLGLDSSPPTALSLLEMYSRSSPDLSFARRVFDEMPSRNAAAWTALVAAHARRGLVADAERLLAAMPEKSAVAWTAVVSGHAAAGDHAAALAAFQRMQRAGTEPDWVALVVVLASCARLGALETGRWVHALAVRMGLLHAHPRLGNALVEMYAKCGSVEHARQVFNSMPRRDVVSWTAMIGGLARHGRAAEAVALFDAMGRAGEAVPNGVTVLAAISACAHAGMTDKGLEIFGGMGAARGVEHYGCVVDLLARAGRVREALKVVSEMPVEPDAAVWGALLGASRSRGEDEVAALAAERLLELEPESAGDSAGASNACAVVGRWDDVARLRRQIRSQGKVPGCSSIEVGDRVREFVAGPGFGPEFLEISQLLQLLTAHICTREEEYEEPAEADLV
ncbi:pentatricopeptide repeat-containing protein At2g20540-like [Wolffia australiana]